MISFPPILVHLTSVLLEDFPRDFGTQSEPSRSTFKCRELREVSRLDRHINFQLGVVSNANKDFAGKEDSL